jgi:hypothetical protein
MILTKGAGRNQVMKVMTTTGNLAIVPTSFKQPINLVAFTVRPPSKMRRASSRR